MNLESGAFFCVIIQMEHLKFNIIQKLKLVLLGLMGLDLKEFQVLFVWGVINLLAWIKFAYPEHKNPFLDGIYWDPPCPYQWQHPIPPAPQDLRIYECHIGIIE